MKSFVSTEREWLLSYFLVTSIFFSIGSNVFSDNPYLTTYNQSQCHLNMQ